MRGFAVAAGGWDEAPGPRVELHVVADAPTDDALDADAAERAVTDLASHRQRRDALVSDGAAVVEPRFAGDRDAVIVAW
jgi:hypothetical protein